MRNRLIITLLFGIGLWSCKEEPTEPGLPVINGQHVMVLNEGNFQWGNASLSVYDPATLTMTNQVFKRRNDRPMGDVAQSISRFGAFYYVVINNSGSVMLLDSADFKLVDEWKGFTSPRYMIHVDMNTAVVSDLYAKGVVVVDKSSGTIVKKIPINGWTDKMIRFNNELLVTNRDGAAIYRIDLTTLQIKDSISVSDQPNQMVFDADSNLWVLCSGKTGQGKGALWKLDPVSGKNLRKFDLNVSAFVNHLAVSGSGEEIYFIEKNLYKMNYRDTVLPDRPFIELGLKTPYNLTINHLNGDIYVTDAKDFLSRSTLNRYAEGGNKIDEVEAGIIAGDILIQR